MAQVFKRFVKVANFHPNSVTLDDKEQTKFYNLFNIAKDSS